MAKKRAKSKLPKATSAVVAAGKLSNCAKNEALIVYADQLVQKKLA